jgi:phosphomannomutase
MTLSCWAMNHAPLMLSVSGARGIVGQSLTPALAADFASAFGSCIKDATQVSTPLICLGRDSRPSGAMFAAAATAGLTAVGCRVIDLGVVATPTVGVAVKHRAAQGGMVITASHNPIEWNGLKCINALGMALPQQDIEQVIARFRQHDLAYVGPLEIGTMETDASAHQLHIDNVLNLVDVDAIRRAGFHVVLDSVNGAGCVAGRMLLEQLGCQVTHLHGDPTGIFAHTPEPTEENLRELAETVSQTANAACGFAQDPDADRLAIVDEHGRYIGEEYTLVLAAKRMLDLRGPGDLAANLSTSRMIDDLASQYAGSRVHRSPVGEANVATLMQQHHACIGGEGNGGVIVPDICWVRDSLSSMALVLSHMAANNKPLSTLVDALPRYAMLKSKFDLRDIGGHDAVAPALQRVQTHFADETINASDGVRIDFADGWVHIRPSNTEPILRLIAEAKDTARAEALIASVLDAAGLR